MEDADEGAHEILGVGVGVEVAAVDGALNCGEEGGVDEIAGAFHEAGGAAGDAVEGGKDQEFVFYVSDEVEHPGA